MYTTLVLFAEFQDYEATGEMIVFQPTSSDLAVDCPTISLTLYDDPVVEGNEEVLLQLFSMEPERIVVTDNNGNPYTAVLTIIENDSTYNYILIIKYYH